MSATAMNTGEAQALHRGGCFCGALSYEVTGKPLLSAYCHCTLCQRLNSAPFIHTIHFPAKSFKFTHPEPLDLSTDCFQLPAKPWKNRYRCKSCGVCVASYNSQKDKWSVWGTQLERDESGKLKDMEMLKPTAHIFYGTRLLDIQDNLAKWEGYPNQSKQVSES